MSVRIFVINLGTSGIIELHFTFFYINSLFGIFSFYELILKLFKHGTISIFSTFIDIKYEKELGAIFWKETSFHFIKDFWGLFPKFFLRRPIHSIFATLIHDKESLYIWGKNWRLHQSSNFLSPSSNSVQGLVKFLGLFWWYILWWEQKQTFRMTSGSQIFSQPIVPLLALFNLESSNLKYKVVT